MGFTKKIINELTDLPNYKDAFTNSLSEFGVATIEDLSLVLLNNERTDSMIAAVKGLGPRTVQSWKKALLSSEEIEPEEIDKGEPVDVSVETEEESEPLVEESVKPEEKVDEESSVTTIDDIPPTPKFERNLFCTMGDLSEIEKTTIDLLQMNGAKKKGLAAEVDYVVKKLTATGMEVTVNLETAVPVIVASKGEGGIILWGHLDTERMAGMKRKNQGVVQGDMINGRGAANMKGAVATMICAASRLVSWQVPFSIVLTTDALDQQKGAEAMANDSVIQQSKGIIMFRPTGMRPVIGQYGYAAIRVTTLGDEAVMKMASFLKTLTGLIEDSSGRLSVKTGLIRGGKRKMPYASALSCEVVLEFETQDATDTAMQMIEAILGETEHDVEILCQSEMAEFDRTSDLVASVSELTRTEPVFDMIHSEAGKIVSANQKIVICGPGNVVNSLSNQEYVTLSELEKTFEAILGLLDEAEPLKN